MIMSQIIAPQSLYLASASPRRQELMLQMNLQFDVVQAPVDEVVKVNESPQDYVERIATEKAVAGAEKINDENVWVVGGDTAVIIESRILGKPASNTEANEMLRLLSGKTHQVFSAVTVFNKQKAYKAVNKTEVCFKVLTDKEIDSYILSGEPEGKAGGYAIQGLGAAFIERINGSYSGVMGLPLFELNRLLEESGYHASAIQE